MAAQLLRSSSGQKLLLIGALLLLLIVCCSSFLIHHHHRHHHHPYDTTSLTTTTTTAKRATAFSRQGKQLYQQPQSSSSSSSSSNSSNDDGQVGSGPNWLERSFPVKDDDNNNTAMSKNTVEDYDLGLNGNSFQVGPLSLRMYDAIRERSSALDQVSDPEQIQQILRALKLYALDFTAKEAVRAALKQNGLELALQDDEQDMNMWGEVDSIQLLDMETNNEPVGPIYDDWEEAVDYWTPGQAFNFVVRQVPAKMRELSLEELLQALDPDGSLRKEAKEAGVKYMTPNSDECQSLAEMASENVRRVEETPQEAVAEDEVFAGTSARGYQVIAASDLEKLWDDSDGSSSSFLQSKTVLHVMDALVSHGCLTVDISSGERDMVAAEQLSKMWKTCESFFTTVVDTRTNEDKSLPPLVTAEGTGSKYAKIGYASYNDGNMQFLETRVSRETGELLPSEVQSLLGPEGCDSLKNAFDVLASAGKNVIRVAVTASAFEAAESIPGSIPNDFDPVLAGKRVAEELVDDGRQFEAAKDDLVCMSPHRICRYSNKKAEERQSDERDELIKQTTKEIFGAHTDSTFVTIVPVAEVSGLEVYDEAAETWFRPEMAARRHYNENYAADSSDDLPWYARYCVVMPGEFLQLLSRQEILASVHRVVATRHSQSRYSAPILLRGRSSIVLDASRYFGKASTLLLKECDGRTMDDIHSAMQPGSFQ